jgi:hypothetical protein
MKKIITICFMLIAAGNSFAQQITFQKAYGGVDGDECYSVQQTTDGGYIMVGNTDGFGAGIWLIYLIKTDAYGDTLWTKTIGGGGYDNGRSVQQTTDGGYIIAGYGDSFGTGGFNIYLIRTDATGSLLWSKTFGGSPTDIYTTSVQQTTDGGYIVTGNFGSSNGDEVYLIKADANGDSLWTKTYGGVDDDNGHFVEQTNDGGYIITGETYSFGVGGSDVYLIKTDSVGNLLWSKTFGGTDDEVGFSVHQTTDGGYIIAGYYGSNGGGGMDIYLLKTDISGNLLWSKTLSGGGVGFSVQQTTDGGYIVTGYTGNSSASICLIKTDASGNLLWSKTFGGTYDDWAGSVQQTADGGYIITGYTQNYGAGGYNDVYLIKTDSLGNSGCHEANYTTVATIHTTQVTSPATITSSPADIVTSPSIPTGSGSIVTALCTSVGIKEILNREELILFPNPFSDKINITTKTNEPVEITLFDITSRKLLHQQFTNTLTLNTSHLSKGIYIYELRPVPFSSGNKNGVIKKGKIVKD